MDELCPLGKECSSVCEGFKPGHAELGIEQASQRENTDGGSGQEVPSERNKYARESTCSHGLRCIANESESSFEPLDDGWESTSAGWRAVYADLDCGGDAQ